MAKRVVFVGLSGYGYPHTRVRCYNFQRELSERWKVPSTVLSFRDHLGPEFSEADMYRLRDRQKLRLTWKALARLRRERGNLFYIQKAHFHSAAPFLLHRLGRNPYILDYDDYDVELSNFFGRGVWNRLFFGSHRWDTITERMARRAVCCVAASHELIDYLKSFHSKVYYVPTGVDVEAFEARSYPSAPGPVVFLWNGLVWGEPILRSVQLLLEAFADVHHSNPAVQLRIIGGGDCFEPLRQLVQREYAHCPIRISGWVDPKEMPQQLKQADVACLPFDAAQANRWVRSKSPTKMFEYMATALPVVASGVGEATHVIEDGKSGLLVADRGEMAQAMKTLAERPPLRQEIGLAARKRIEQHFSLPVLGARLHALLAEHGWGGGGQ